MSYPIVRIDPTTAGRERSPALWAQALENYSADRALGVLRADDFTDPLSTAGGAASLSTDGKWWCAEAGTTGVTSENFTTLTEPDGHASLTAVADADYKGIQVHAGPTAALVENIVLPTATTDSKGDVYFECRVNLAVASNSTLFVGLAEAAATILTGTNLLTQASDYIGFYRLDNGDLSLVSHNDQNGTQYSQVVQTTAQLLVLNATFVKLGFKVSAGSKVKVYVNGTQIKKDSSNAVITVPVLRQPVEKLARKLSVAGGDDGIDPLGLICDWIDCYVAE